MLFLARVIVFLRLVVSSVLELPTGLEFRLTFEREAWIYTSCFNDFLLLPSNLFGKSVGFYLLCCISITWSIKTEKSSRIFWNQRTIISLLLGRIVHLFLFWCSAHATLWEFHWWLFREIMDLCQHDSFLYEILTIFYIFWINFNFYLLLIILVSWKSLY